MTTLPLFGDGEADAGMHKAAEISSCGRYRYRLERRWSSARPGPVVWVMLNPSTADAELDDPTIRRCIGFSGAWDYGSLVVINRFAWRATDPKDLRAAWKRGEDIDGPENRTAWKRACEEAHLIVCAWGATEVEAREQEHDGDELLELAGGKQVFALGFTAAGYPVHPLYQPADAELVRITGCGR